MTRTLYDATLNDISEPVKKTSLGIPIVDDFRSESSFSMADLFVITGSAQSYKTTLAVEILSKFMENSPNSTALWIDCDFKFPLNCLKDKSVDLGRLQRVRCKCSEQILFTLQKIHYLVQTNNRNYSRLQTIVLDGLTSSYAIDQNTYRHLSSISSKAPKLFYQMKNLIEVLVYELGLRVIVTLHDFGFSSPLWNYSRFTSTQYLTMKKTDIGKGYVICNEICDRFKIIEGRAFHWGKRNLVQHINEFNNKEDENEDKMRRLEDNEEANIVI